MMESATLPRRTFVQLVLSGLVAAGCGDLLEGRDRIRAYRVAVPDAWSGNAARYLEALRAYFSFEDLDAVRQLGSYHLWDEIPSREAGAVEALLARVVGLLHAAPSRDAAVARAEAAVRTDLEQHAIVTVGGWIVSTTEIELCALAQVLS